MVFESVTVYRVDCDVDDGDGERCDATLAAFGDVHFARGEDAQAEMARQGWRSLATADGELIVCARRNAAHDAARAANDAAVHIDLSPSEAKLLRLIATHDHGSDSPDGAGVVFHRVNGGTLQLRSAESVKLGAARRATFAALAADGLIEVGYRGWQELRAAATGAGRAWVAAHRDRSVAALARAARPGART